MGHLFKLMHGAYELENLNIDDIINIVFASTLDKRISILEKKNNEHMRACETTDDENRWMKFSDKALATVHPDVIWLAIQETCRVLALSQPSDNQRGYLDSLFDMSWMLWESM